jgi:propanol-preferring alcohol dehydrogenase
MIPTTMFAAVYQPGNDNLVINKHYPIRELEDNEVLLKVLAVGGTLVLSSRTQRLTASSLPHRRDPLERGFSR